MSQEEDITNDDFLEYLRSEAQQERQEQFEQWCEQLEGLPADSRLVLKGEFRADVELQPHYWLSAGLDLIKSGRGTVSVRNFDGSEGSPLSTYLTYPTFQMGTEIFLKGMWLCQFEECRKLRDRDYLAPGRRDFYQRKLKRLGHDLLVLIEAVRGIVLYQQEGSCRRFLKILEGIVRQYYFPLYEADKRASEWASSRYPKRFYDDSSKQGRSDSFRSHPQAWLIAGLFEPMENRIDRLWQIRRGLISRD